MYVCDFHTLCWFVGGELFLMEGRRNGRGEVDVGE